jgi:hypothetical protein
MCNNGEVQDGSVDLYGVTHTGFSAVDPGKTTPQTFIDQWVGMDFVGADSAKRTNNNNNKNSKKDIKRIRINQVSRNHASTTFSIEFADNDDSQACGVLGMATAGGMASHSWTAVASCGDFVISSTNDEGAPLGWFEFDIGQCTTSRLFLEQDQAHHYLGSRKQHYSMWERFKFRDDPGVWGSANIAAGWPLDNSLHRVGIH